MKFFYSLIILCCFGRVFSQDTHVTQYFVSPQIINPAAFGVINKFEAGLQYKSQWNAFAQGFTSYSAFTNVQIPTKKKKSGFFAVGLNMVHDKSGDGKLTTLVAGVPVNYSVRLNAKNYLTTGLNLGYNQKAISGANLTWGSQYDGFKYDPALPNENITQLSTTVLDFGAGMAWVNKKDGKQFTHMNDPFNIVGFSIAHINQPSYSLYKNSNEKMMMRFNLYQYCNIFLTDNVYISPSVMLQRQGSATEIIIGNMFRYKLNVDSYITGIRGSNSIGFGAYLRVFDGLLVNGVFEHKNYSFGISYDINLSALKQSSKAKGGAEIFIKIKNPYDYLLKGHARKARF